MSCWVKAEPFPVPPLPLSPTSRAVGCAHPEPYKMNRLQGFQHFMSWVKAEIVAGHHVTLGVIEESVGPDELPYAHIVNAVSRLWEPDGGGAGRERGGAGRSGGRAGPTLCPGWVPCFCA